ncbi:isopropylmalate isomerase [uncultured Roseobacter sp.]|uniref:isopropylmalate isomerase n=1 Tax=uncultured Roseobacter sp. TaxID=114847 RepID=UPI0026137D2D|nr:isopropylmalate isomerase [uncultured Roseobacter sp.]
MEPSFIELISRPVPMGPLLSCVQERWQPQIGDPSLIGWVTVGIYVVVALALLRTARQGAFPSETVYRERWLWLGLLILVLFLAINKQLDLQSALTATGRCTAKLQGWYSMRWDVQRGFILALAVSAAGACVILFYVMRNTLRRTGMALLGTAFVFGFILIRAADFHHMDQIIDLKISSALMNWVLELTGLMLILLATFRHPKAHRPDMTQGGARDQAGPRPRQNGPIEDPGRVLER